MLIVYIRGTVDKRRINFAEEYPYLPIFKKESRAENQESRKKQFITPVFTCFFSEDQAK
jgi:hypothetical protein